MAHYTRMPNQERILDFRDTFLDWQHLRASFPDYTIQIKEEGNERHRVLDPPYKLTFPPSNPENDTEAVTIAVER